jgi:glycosyltransferase involved in cell wall biosynthesis
MPFRRLVRRARLGGLEPSPGVRAANKRILFFDDRQHTMRGGQQVLVDLIGAAADAGYETHLATFGEGPLTAAGRAAGAQVHLWPLPDGLGHYDGYFKQASRRELLGAALQSGRLGLDLAGRVAELDPAAVYLSALRPAVFLWPLVVHRRRSLWFAQGNANLGPLSRAASLVPTHLAAVSVASRTCFGLRDPSLLDVPTVAVGVDTASIVAKPRPDRPAGTAGADARPVKVLCVGEVTPAKGQARLAAACERLHHRTGFDVELSLVGGVSSTVGERYLPTVFAAAPSIKIIDRGWQHDLSRVYAEHDLLALTSEAEGTPRVFVEALAAGIPVVSTAVGGIEEVFGHRIGVGLVPADAGPDTIAHALLSAATNRRDPALLRAQLADFEPDLMLGRLLGLLTGEGPVAADARHRAPSRRHRLSAHLHDLASSTGQGGRNGQRGRSGQARPGPGGSEADTAGSP